MELDRLKYLPFLRPDECRSASVYEMSRIYFKAVVDSDKVYDDVFQVLGRGEVSAGIMKKSKAADILYIRRVNLGVDEQGNFVSYLAPVGTCHRIQLEDIVKYVPLQPKL